MVETGSRKRKASMNLSVGVYSDEGRRPWWFVLNVERRQTKPQINSRLHDSKKEDNPVERNTCLSTFRSSKSPFDVFFMAGGCRPFKAIVWTHLCEE